MNRGLGSHSQQPWAKCPGPGPPHPCLEQGLPDLGRPWGPCWGLSTLVTPAPSTREVSKLVIPVHGLSLWLLPGFRHRSEGFPWICSSSDEPRDSPLVKWRQRVRPGSDPGRIPGAELWPHHSSRRGRRCVGPERRARPEPPSPRPRAPTFPPGRPGLRPSRTMPPSRVQTGGLDAHAPFCSSGSGVGERPQRVGFGVRQEEILPERRRGWE